MTINLRLKFRPDIWLIGKIPVLQGEKKFHKIFLCTRHNLYCLSDKFYASGIRYLWSVSDIYFFVSFCLYYEVPEFRIYS